MLRARVRFLMSLGMCGMGAVPEATPFVVMLFPGILPSPYQRLVPQQVRRPPHSSAFVGR